MTIDDTGQKDGEALTDCHYNGEGGWSKHRDGCKDENLSVNEK